MENELDAGGDSLMISESLLHLKQIYNDIAYCLTNYHLEYFKKLMKQLNNKLKEKQKSHEEQKFTFDSKFKFKTLYLNKKAAENVIEKQVEKQNEKEVFELEIEKISDYKN